MLFLFVLKGLKTLVLTEKHFVYLGIEGLAISCFNKNF